MKRAAALLLPVLATGLAACGSGNNSQADVPAMTNAQSKPEAVPAAPKPAATPKASRGKTTGHRGTKTSPSRRGARAKAKAMPTTPAPLPAHAQYRFGVNAKAILPAGGFVPAGAPFELVIASVDGKSHTVQLRSPTQRTIQVDPKNPGKLSFGGLAPGRYELQLDGAKAKATLVAIKVPTTDPKS
ncbi:MAG TPA: hypothetical protein VGJ32_15360 [Solirubrobacteraceae bacterium]|jgi:hypothetical protein